MILSLIIQMYNLIPWNLYIHFPIRYLLALWLAMCLFSEMWLWHFLVCVTFDLYCYILNQSFGWAEMARCNPFDPTCVCSVAQVVSDFDSILYVACQAPLSMGFSKQEDWSGLPFPFPGNIPDPGIELVSLVSSALAGRFFTTAPPEKPRESHINNSLKGHFKGPWMIYVCVGKFLHMVSLGAVKEMNILTASVSYCQPLLSSTAVVGVGNSGITKGVIQLPIAGHAYMINTLQWALRMD